jgi:hypothetical protein
MTLGPGALFPCYLNYLTYVQVTESKTTDYNVRKLIIAGESFIALAPRKRRVLKKSFLTKLGRNLVVGLSTI